ncbi:PQQ-binding-like beta-propeller repeat protein [Streptoverticillium reticulum]|uniref:outer membrane protein assembly factor BamB family protein n=1 Tax=Streptomyces TaxID=1883 RepID=UPI0036B27BCF
MTHPVPPQEPGARRPPQVWDTRFDPPSSGPSGPQGFGPAPVPYGPGEGGGDTGGGPGRGRRKALLVVLALVLVAGLGGGGWLLWGDHGKGVKRNAGPAESAQVDTRLDWMIPTPDKEKGADVHASNPMTWFAHGNIVRTRDRQITAYDIEHGKQQWNVPLAGEVCKAARRPENDMVAVLYEKEKYKCNNLILVDLKSGRAKWEQKLPSYSGDGEYIDPQVRLSRGTVKVMGTSEEATFAVADGKVLDHPKTNVIYDCAETDAPTDGKILISIVKCSSSNREFLRKIDSATGRVDWTWKAPEGLDILSVPSIDPVTVSVGKSEADGPTDLLSVNSEGRTQSTYSLTGQAGGHVSVRGDTAYLATQPKETSAGIKQNEIQAIDLKTGEKRWSSTAGGNRVNRSLDFDGDKLLVYQAPQAGEGGKLVDLDLRDGSPSVRKKLPAESSSIQYDADFGSEIYLQDDRVFIVADIAIPSNYLIMSFT